jgi:hypothetical protein
MEQTIKQRYDIYTKELEELGGGCIMELTLSYLKDINNIEPKNDDESEMKMLILGSYAIMSTEMIIKTEDSMQKLRDDMFNDK